MAPALLVPVPNHAASVIPLDDRPRRATGAAAPHQVTRQRLGLTDDPDALPDSQLLAAVLGAAEPDPDVLAIGQRLLQAHAATFRRLAE